MDVQFCFVLDKRACAKKPSHINAMACKNADQTRHMWYPPHFQNSEKKIKIPAATPTFRNT